MFKWFKKKKNKEVEKKDTTSLSIDEVNSSKTLKKVLSTREEEIIDLTNKMRKKIMWCINSKINEVFSFKETNLDFSVPQELNSNDAIIFMDYFESLKYFKENVLKRVNLKKNLSIKDSELFNVYVFFMKGYVNQLSLLDNKLYKNEKLNKKYNTILDLLKILKNLNDIPIETSIRLFKKILYNKFSEEFSNLLQEEKLFEDKKYLYFYTLKELEHKNIEIQQFFYSDLFQNYKN